MAATTVTTRLDGNGLRFITSTGSGHTIATDDAAGDSGPRPMELLLVAQAACTAMDVASILRKARQAFTGYEVRVAGEQREDRPPHVYERIEVVHFVDGDVDVEVMRRAVQLSATRYCSVAGNLASGIAEIRHGFVVRDASGDAQYREVVVTGPSESPDALGQRVTAHGA